LVTVVARGPHIDFRQLHVVVAHPRDHDGDVLLRYLQSLGCHVEHLWPPVDRLEGSCDLLFGLIDAQTRPLLGSVAGGAALAIIGVVDPASTGTLQLLRDIGPQAVLHKPIDPPAILANVVVARSNARYQKRLLGKIAKLEETLRSVRKVERAKAILMETRHLDESSAYAYLREQAMRKRVPIGVVAGVVVDSKEMLSDKKE
jgi:AmiR/NasT family two-component response regulator